MAKLIDAKTAADYIGISYWMITNLARNNKIPCVKMGDRHYFKKDSLDSWVDDLEKKSINPVQADKNAYGIKKIKE